MSTECCYHLPRNPNSGKSRYIRQLILDNARNARTKYLYAKVVQELNTKAILSPPNSYYYGFEGGKDYLDAQERFISSIDKKR